MAAFEQDDGERLDDAVLDGEDQVLDPGRRLADEARSNSFCFESRNECAGRVVVGAKLRRREDDRGQSPFCRNKAFRMPEGVTPALLARSA